MASELESYRRRLDDLRGQVRDLVAELPAEALNWRPIESDGDETTNSIAVLAAHVAGAEHFWITENIGGRARTRDRAAEFATKVDNPAGLIRRLDEVAAETREVFSELSEADIDSTRQVEGREVPVRWAIQHVMEHLALHIGHMQITYQLWMGGKSKPSPRWQERLRSA